MQRPSRSPSTRPPSLSAAFALAFFTFLTALGPGPEAAATEVKIHRSGGASELSEGELEGVRLDRFGRLHLARHLEQVAVIEEPFVHSLAVTPDGDWIVGTGSDGRVLRLKQGAGATVEVLLDTPEAEVFAVAVAADGTIYAGTSPNGKVYRLPPGAAALPADADDGEAEAAEELEAGGADPREEAAAEAVFFDPGELYIWDLLVEHDGHLKVATGTGGKLYAVDPDGRGEVLYDSQDVHLRTLHRAPSGDLLLGTAGQGLVLRRTAAGIVETLYDAPQPEIVGLTTGPDGTLYLAAVASEGSLVDLSQVSAQAGDDDDDDDEAAAEDAFAGVGTRPSGFGAGRSEVVALDRDGDARTLASFQEETVYSLLWWQEALWIGTGMEGQIATWTEDGLVLEEDLEERQVVALLVPAGASGPQLATTNGGAVYRFGQGLRTEGTYLSKVLDAEQLARLGSLRWRGRGSAESLRMAVRSGVSAAPDASWSPWVDLEAPAGSRGRKSGAEAPEAGLAGTEVSLKAVPLGRYFQWRATFQAPEKKGVAAPRLDGVEVSYRHRNQAPKIADFEILEPGQILVPSNFNPSNQVFEPAHPTRDGMFTTLSAEDQKGEGRLKSLWKLGYRALRWNASDANRDSLTYALSFRFGEGVDDPDEGSEGAAWLPIAEDLDSPYYNFDATALPDGVYRFRLVASDADDNLADEGETAEKLSPPVVVDHSPPRLGKLSLGPPAGAGGERVLTVVVEDAWNPIRQASLSVDAGPWTPAKAADGLVDGRREQLHLSVPAGARLALLKVMDAAYNVVTFDLSESLSQSP